MFYTPSPSMNTMAEVGAPCAWYPIECAPAALLEHEVYVQHEAYFDASADIDEAMDDEVEVWYDASDADFVEAEVTEPVSSTTLVYLKSMALLSFPTLKGPN